MKKKILIVVGFILFFLIITSSITSFKDNARVRAGIEPKYVIKIVNDKELKITYIGLGYKVIRYVEVNPYGPFGENDYFKYGSWFMKFDRPEKVVTFKGKVIESINESITVEVLDDCESFKKGDQVLVHITNYKYKNIQYEKDMVVTIEFDGLVNETYPLQISTDKIYLDLKDY